MGSQFEVIGYGLRQPFIGVHPKTGLVTASDQQGNYVPSTPLHIISDHQFYGHLPTIAPKEQYPETIAEPLDVDSASGESERRDPGVAHRCEDGADQ